METTETNKKHIELLEKLVMVHDRTLDETNKIAVFTQDRLKSR
jgi:hypothetical protein